MEIAKGYKTSDYQNLDLKDPQSKDWDVAVQIFQHRIELRYLQPIRLLIEHEKSLPARDQNFGFSITAIICLLIETLYCFRNGIIDNSGKGKVKKAFVKFLTTTTSFNQIFSKKTASIFCDHFRNGILHQAETKANSRIRAVGPAVREINNSISINRTAIFQLLEKEFKQYLFELSDPSSISLRQPFKAKMDHVCLSRPKKILQTTGKP